jgi:hypothetical protein
MVPEKSRCLAFSGHVLFQSALPPKPDELFGKWSRRRQTEKGSHRHLRRQERRRLRRQERRRRRPPFSAPSSPASFTARCLPAFLIGAPNLHLLADSLRYENPSICVSLGITISI